MTLRSLFAVRCSSLRFERQSDNVVFSTSLPDTIGALTKLQSLRLSSMNLSGTVPDTLGGLVALTELDLSLNAVTGTIPRTVSNLTSLRYGRESPLRFCAILAT